MDNDEKNVYRYMPQYKKLETHPYTKPEDWFNLYVKKINNHKTYANMKKEDIWLSDNLSPKSKILLVSDDQKSYVFYDRFYNLIYENSSSGKVVVNPALNNGSEPARFDYCTNIKQEKIFGISGFNKRSISISYWYF